MDWLLGKVQKCLGPDKTAYAQFSVATIIWVLSFLYVSENNIDAYSSNLSRGLVLFLYNVPAFFRSNFKILTPISMRNMIQRHCLLVFFGFIYAQSFFYLSINLVNTIYFAGPLFVMAIDYFLHGINITKPQIVGVILSCVGVLLAVNGNLLYLLFDPSVQFHSKFTNFKPEASSGYVQIVASLILIIAQLGWAYSVVLVKKIKGATHYQLNFQYGAIMIMSAGLLYYNTKVPYQIRLQSFLWSIVFQGIPLAIAQALFVHSMTITKNLGVLTMTSFLSVVLSYFLKIFRYEETMNWICLSGTLLILWGVYRIVIKQT